ncbi:hypothetical protein ACFWM0_01880 [Streptomyces sp. NPDC058405]|uniref:hypothetical protein n=1 Tax=unclassified Streptomyces TaxID=2593676 RepID=UPI00365065F7
MSTGFSGARSGPSMISGTTHGPWGSVTARVGNYVTLRPRKLGKYVTVDSRSAQHLERDLDAVAAGLTLPWNSGVVEGHVDRIKMLKREMFGRAGFELLRKRLLLA